MTVPILEGSSPWLVFGATGQVGRAVLARCHLADQPILALSRQAAPRPAGRAIRWLPARLPDAVPALPPVCAVLSLGPLDLFSQWLQHWQPAAGAPAVVALSSMSAVSKAASRHGGERQLAARMQGAEDDLAQRCDELGLPWTVLRPTLMWGAGMDRSLSPLARRAMRWHCMPVPMAQGLRQPVHVDDVADAVLASLRKTDARGCRIECGGGERLSVHLLFQRIRASMPQPTLAVPVPALLSRAMAPAARFSRVAAAAARLNVDLLADNSQLEGLLDIHPRGFAPESGDWRPPDDAE